MRGSDHARHTRSARGLLAAGLALSLLLAPSAAQAGCCRLIRIDPPANGGRLQACDPDAAGGCGSVLFDGTLGTGETQQVCSSADTIIYLEYNASQSAFGPSTEALCTGADVQL